MPSPDQQRTVKLPDTAEPWYNILLFGFIGAVFSAIVALWRVQTFRRK